MWSFLGQMQSTFPRPSILQFNHIEFDLHIVRGKFLCFLPFYFSFSFLPGGLGWGKEGREKGEGCLYFSWASQDRMSGQLIYRCLYISHLQCSVFYEILCRL